MKKEIVLSRMFTGKYLNSNIGHEAINLFKADDGQYLDLMNKFSKKKSRIRMEHNELD